MKQSKQERERGSITVEATFVILIVIIVIFTLLYLLFYCCDCVKEKSCFWYDLIAYGEQQEQESLLQDVIEAEGNEDFEIHIKENFKAGILSYGVEECESRVGVWNNTYTVDIGIVEVFPLIKNLFGNNRSTIRYKCIVHSGNPCEIARMYQAFMVKE